MRNLAVLTTSRNVREFYKNLDNSLVSCEAVTLGDFFSKVLYVKDLAMANEYQSFVIMQRAAFKVSNLSDKLGIDSNFLAFLKNKEYIFSFYKELKKERVELLKLNQNDTYLDYQEHLLILENLLKIYQKDLVAHGLYDDIILPDKFEINFDYLKQFKEISVKIDGILTKFDWEVLQEIAKKCELNIKFRLSKFNKKLKKAIYDLVQLELDEGFEYEISLSKSTIMSKIPTKTIENRIKFRPFSQRNLQISFVFDEISKFVRNGIDPKRIAVILPDENFSQIIRLFDNNNMLNYAMGDSFCNSKTYLILSNLKEWISDSVFEDSYLTSSSHLTPKNSLLNYLKVDKKIFDEISQIFSKVCNIDEFQNLIFGLLAGVAKDEIDILKSEIFELRPLFDYRLKFCEILEMLLIGLRGVNISLVGGGEVGVYGLLESRSMEFDGVIIVDFNENLVPKRSSKELFLNSKVRENSGLISHSDRENLQRFYYENLINNAKFVSISCVEDDENMPCIFLRDFDYFIDNKFSQNAYEKGLYNEKNVNINLDLSSIVLKHDFFEKPISYSKLNTFLTCKRSYYYKYILQIREPRKLDVLVDFSFKGKIKHKIFEEYFKTYNNKFDKVEFINIARSYFSELDPLSKEIFIINLDEIQNSHEEWFNKGFSVKYCELEAKKNIDNFSLYGIIDRVDINGDTVAIIDYKSGKIQDKSMQLAFYEILIDAQESYYFDLKSSLKFIQNKVSKDAVYSAFDEIKTLGNTINFEQNLSECKYCPYALMCKKEIF